MVITLLVPNFSDRNIKERTALAADVSVGSNSITLSNNNNITTGDYIAVGNGETREILTVSSPSGATTLSTNNTTLFHNENEAVIALIGSQIKLYRAADVSGIAPAETTFSAILSPVNIDPDQPMTKITDPTGGSGFWYKFTYYNPVTASETQLSDSVAVRGGGIGNYASIESIRQEAGFANNPNISDGLIDSKRQFAQAEINSALGGIYQVPFAQPVNPLIEQITLMLAAGYLQLDQYGAYTTTDTNNGNSKVSWAEEMLEKLKNGQLTLQDAAGVPVPVGASSMGFSGSPSSTTYPGHKFHAYDRY